MLKITVVAAGKLKEKFWVGNFILFKLCYFYVIVISNFQ